MGARRILKIVAPFALVAGLGLAWWGAHWLEKRPIDSSGGLYFPGRTVLPVPAFLQADPRWGNDLLGPTPGTLGGEGCAVASAAMVMASYGADTDPGRLNAFLTKNGGFTDRGWLRWEAVPEIAPDVAEFAYEDLPSFFLIDWNLLRGNPVIVRLRYPDGPTHFVVICGKEGSDYLISDPGSSGIRGVYPLKDLTREIEALRYYRRLR